ncbi:MAG: site-specific DNA-methyltransferase [Gloeomargarita sp. SKYB31]|nr:site-specific DNA-methyltransferase [Gloeomargarita sp. SKYB31]
MQVQTLVLEGDCLDHVQILDVQGYRFALTFLDPPFNQGKEYACVDDDLPKEAYWRWMGEVCRAVVRLTLEGGAIYFMQREKKAGQFRYCHRRRGRRRYAGVFVASASCRRHHGVYSADWY